MVFVRSSPESNWKRMNTTVAYKYTHWYRQIYDAYLKKLNNLPRKSHELHSKLTSEDIEPKQGYIRYTGD